MARCTRHEGISGGPPVLADLPLWVTTVVPDCYRRRHLLGPLWDSPADPDRRSQPRNWDPDAQGCQSGNQGSQCNRGPPD